MCMIKDIRTISEDWKKTAEKERRVPAVRLYFRAIQLASFEDRIIKLKS